MRHWCAALAVLALAVTPLTAVLPGIPAASGAPARAVSDSPVAGLAAHGGTFLAAPHSVPGGALGPGGGHEQSSDNWSGYAAHGATYKRVSAHWTEPSVTCPSGSQFSSFWVGLDGFTSNSVEQTGSEADCDGGRPRYYAWYEMFPAASVNFGDRVKPGDHFYADVVYSGGGKYALIIKDYTQHWSKTVHARAHAKNASAEVILEAPCCTNNGGILPLAHFSPVAFTSAQVDGKPIGALHPTGMFMATDSGDRQDRVTALRQRTDFTATWVASH